MPRYIVREKETFRKLMDLLSLCNEITLLQSEDLTFTATLRKNINIIMMAFRVNVTIVAIHLIEICIFVT